MVKKEIKFVPGYATDDSYHGMHIFFILSDKDLAVVWQLNTDWTPQKGLALSRWDRVIHHLCECHPYSYGIDWHSTVPLSSEECESPNCEFLSGKTCHGGHTDLTDDLFPRFVEAGEPAVWEELQRRFDKLKKEQIEAKEDIARYG